MALRDVFVRLGIQVDGSKKLDDVDQSLRKTLLTARQFGQTLRYLGQYFLVGAVVNGVKNFILGQIQQADALKHSAEALGITTDELQKFQYVSSIMQVPVQQTAVALRFFNRAIGEASFGGKAATTAFGRLGMSVKDAHGQVRPTDELLFEFADKLQKIPSQAQRTAIAMRTLGRGGAAMLPSLQQGSAALKEMFKDIDELGGGFTEEFAEQAHETDRQLKRLRMGWRSIYVALVTEVLPVMNRWISNSIRTVKNLIDFAKHTYGVKTALMALTSAAVIFGLKRLFDLFKPAKVTVAEFMMTLLRNAPLVALAGLALLAYLAFDELFTGLKGGETVLGHFLDTIGGPGTGKKFFEDLSKAIDGVKVALGPTTEAFTKLGLEMVTALVTNMPAIIKNVGKFFSYMAIGLDVIITSFITAGKLLEGLVTSKAWGAVLGRGTASLDSGEAGSLIPVDEATEQAAAATVRADAATTQASLKSTVDAFANRVDSLTTVINTLDRIPSIGGKTPGPAPEAPGTGTGTRETPLNITTNITVQTNGDPKATGDAVRAGAHKGIKNALSAHRDTFAAVNMGQPQTGT
jgi:hypothetical protein